MSFLIAATATVVVHYYLPFPKDDPVLELIGAERPHIFSAFKAIYVSLSFTSPYIVTSTVLSLVYIFIVRRDGGAIRGRLPRYVDPAERGELYLVVGEIHHPKKPVPRRASPMADDSPAGTLHRPRDLRRHGHG